MMNRMKKIRRMLLAGLGSAAILAGGAPAQAQTYPDRPVKLLVGYAPGGGIDILGRFLAQQLADRLGQPVVVENRAGASGSLAAQAIATASPDGYTLFMGESATLVAPSLQPVNYDPVRDFAPVAQIGALVYGIAVHPDVTASSLDELVAMARRQPGKLNYGTPGIGNIVHLGWEQLKRSSGLDMLHVPYKGGGPMLTDLMSGHIPIGMTSMASLVGLERSGRVKLIGVTSAERSPQYPQVQALSEILPGFEAVSNIYIVAPRNTPDKVVRALNAAFNEIMRNEQTREFFSQQGSLTRIGTPEALGERIQAEVLQWRKLVSDIGLSPQQ